MVDILNAMLTDRLRAVEAARIEAPIPLSSRPPS